MLTYYNPTKKFPALSKYIPACTGSGVTDCVIDAITPEDWTLKISCSSFFTKKKYGSDDPDAWTVNDPVVEVMLIATVCKSSVTLSIEAVVDPLRLAENIFIYAVSLNYFTTT